MHRVPGGNKDHSVSRLEPSGALKLKLHGLSKPPGGAMYVP